MFDGLIKFLTDRTVSAGAKLGWFFLLLIILILVDNHIGFSFFYNYEKKINQIEKIEAIKQKKTISPQVLKKLNEFENEIIERQNYVKTFTSLFSKGVLKADIQNKTEKTTQNQKKNTKNHPLNTDTIKYLVSINDSTNILPDWDTFIFKEISKSYLLDTTLKDTKIQSQITKEDKRYRSKIWHTLSSSSFLLALMLILLIVPFTNKSTNFETILGIIAMIIMLSGLVWVFQYIFGLIPIILNAPLINYVVNFIGSNAILMSLAYWTNKKNKKE